MVGIRLGTDERGFSLIESTIIFIVIVLLAAGAGLVADKQQNPTDNSKQPKPNVIQLGSQPSTQKSNPTTTALELSSLSIDITVPNAIGDLTYAAPGASGGYGISTKTLTSDDANCIATGNAPPLGDFFKESGTYPATGAPGRLVKQFDTFYIAWSSPQAPCSTSSSVTALADQQVRDLEQSFDTIEEAPGA
jgi:flagellin-like protein